MNSEVKKAVKTAHKTMKKEEKPISLGRQSDGSLYSITLKDMGSMICGGISGGGKSQLLRHIAEQASEQAQVFIVDSKKIGFLEFKEKENCHVITKMELLPKLLQKLVEEMNSRYTEMETNNTDVCEKGRILLIIDEIAEAFLYLTDHERDQIRQILSLGRQCNITIVAATQSPSRRLLSGAIVDMFTTRCALRTASVYASKVIIEMPDAARIPKFSAIITSVNGFKKQIRLLPPKNSNGENLDESHDKIDWDED